MYIIGCVVVNHFMVFIINSLVEKFRDASANVNEIPRRTEVLHNVMFAASKKERQQQLH